MKLSYFRNLPALLATCMLCLGLAAGCSSNNSTPRPTTANMTIRRLQSDGTNTMAYIQFKLLNGTRPYQHVVGGNSDSYNGVADTGREVAYPVGEYKFRVWFPEVVVNPMWPVSPAPRGKVQAELLVNGQVKATINLDASRPTFERDTCSRTVTVMVE